MTSLPEGASQKLTWFGFGFGFGLRLGLGFGLGLGLGFGFGLTPTLTLTSAPVAHPCAQLGDLFEQRRQQRLKLRRDQLPLLGRLAPARLRSDKQTVQLTCPGWKARRSWAITRGG